MKVFSKKTGVGFLVFLCVAVAVCAFERSCIAQNSSEKIRLQRDDWAPDVKAALNELIERYGKDGSDRDSNAYAVFDFDNTSAIFDVEEQLIVYQLETLSFAIPPEKLRGVLLTGLPDPDADLTKYGYMRGSYNDLFADISDAYSVLWEKYGPLTPNGVSENRLGELHNDPYWREFAAKMRMSYDLVCDVEVREISYPWIIYWFTGMTGSEVYAMTKKSCEKYGQVETSAVEWTSPREMKSRVGQVSVEWTSGLSVSANVKELWRSLSSNGIDVWVCSASATDAICAAVDVFGLREYCKGIVAMTVKLDSEGRYLNEYDYSTGAGYYRGDDGAWDKMTRSEKAQTEGLGKSLAVINAIAPEYGGKGPIAGFMDSSGDFNFCTEFKSLKAVVCFNRANRKLTDGGALIAAVALYERDALGYDLRKANESGDVLFLLQGRDENGRRALRASSATLRLGSDKEKTFANDDVEALYDYIRDNKLTVKEALDTFALKRSAKENAFGAASGWLDKYQGYRSR